MDTELDEVDEDKYIIVGDDPISAIATSTRTLKITYQVKEVHWLGLH